MDLARGLIRPSERSPRASSQAAFEKPLCSMLTRETAGPICRDMINAATITVARRRTPAVRAVIRA